MNDPQLAAALRSRSPDALPELLDAYGDQLFSYCWRLLRNRENAQIAMRDALVVATAQIGRLFCDEWLGLWLYCLARAECRRREAVPAADADEPAAAPHQTDADSRQMAWKAVASMDPGEVEALELDGRHHVDLRLVLGLSAAEAEDLLDRARRGLERALGAEIVIRKSHACPDRAEVISDWTGLPTPAMQQRLLEHAVACSACGPHLPRSVSAARVFALLPAPALSSVARLEVLEFFDDSRMSAYRDFTVSRAEEAAGAWFLSPPESADLAPSLDPEPPHSWFDPAPKPADPPPPTAPEPVPSSYSDVAQGFIGSWLSAEGQAEPDSGPPTEPIGSPLRLAPEPTGSRLTTSALVGSKTADAAGPATAPGPVNVPKPARSPESTYAPAARFPEATSVPAATRAPEPTGPPSVTPGPLAPVIPLTVPPPAQEAPARPRQPTANPASRPKAARRRRRVSPVSLAAVASVVVTALFILIGHRMTPTATTASNPPAAATTGSSSAAAQSGGGADATVPVKVKRPAGASSTRDSGLQSASSKTESLAVAASQPGTTPPSAPAQPGAPRTRTRTRASASSSASTSAIPAGSLIVTPDQLDLGTGSTGQLTLTAQGGPVAWSASTSSPLTLSGSQGTLQAGQSVTLVVTLNPGNDGAGNAFVFIDSSPVDGAASTVPSASQAVQVTWTTYHPRPAKPSPSPSPSVSPSPSASSSYSPVGAPSSS
jgi:DNA-directed RNA polymerase specialized sigma24 family protein